MTAAVEARSRTLDLLRAAAVLLVIGRHLPLAAGGVEAWSHGFGGLLHRGGWVGVDLFFVLSGFLVSGLLFKEHLRTGGVKLGSFLARRGLKIYPPFYFLLAVSVAMALLVNGRVPVGPFVRELLFVQNYGQGVWEHTWSLAVEEHFYLLLAAVTALLLWRRRGAAEPFSAIPLLFAVVAVVCLALRFRVGMTQPYRHETHLFRTHLRLDALMFGVLLSYLRYYRPDFFFAVARRGRWALLAAGIACFVPPFLFPVGRTPWLPTIGLTVLYVGAGMILWAVSDREPRASAPVKVLAWLGARSYSIYLWHIPVAVLGERVLAAFVPAGHLWVYVAVYVVGSLVVGVAMNAILENPVLRLRDRWFPRRAEAAPTAASAPAAPPAEPAPLSV